MPGGTWLVWFSFPDRISPRLSWTIRLDKMIRRKWVTGEDDINSVERRRPHAKTARHKTKIRQFPSNQDASKKKLGVELLSVLEPCSRSRNKTVIESNFY
jgi:hypothetical protein